MAIDVYAFVRLSREPIYMHYKEKPGGRISADESLRQQQQQPDDDDS